MKKRGWQFFLPFAATRPFLFLLFTPLLGIKRRARLIKKAHEAHLVTPLPAGLSSLFLQKSAAVFWHLLWYV